MTRRYSAVLLLILSFFITLAARETALFPVRLQLKWWEHQFQFAGYYAAIANGYYQQEGLNVTLLPGGADVDILSEVLTGQADIGIYGGELVQRRINGDDVVLMAIIFQHSQRALMVDARSDIITPSDLRDKPVIINSNERAEFLAMFSAEGISDNELQLLSKDKSSFSKLVEGTVSAMNGNIANQPFLFRQQKHPVRTIRPIEYGINFFGDALFTSEAFLEKHPDEVAAFRRATIKGWQYALEHHEEIINLILTQYNSTKSREHLHYEAAITQSLILADIVEIGHINPRIVSNMAKTYAELGLISSNYKERLQDFIYTPASEATQRETTLMLTTEEQEWLQQHPVIRLGYSSRIEPFLIRKENGDYEGIVLDVYKRVAEELQVKLEIIDTTWPGVFYKIQNKEVDVIGMMSDVAARKNNLLLSDNFIHFPATVYGQHKRNMNINSLEDLKGLRVAYFKNILFIDSYLSQRENEITLLKTDNIKEALKAVLEDRADVMLGLSSDIYFLSTEYLPGIEPIYVSKKSELPSNTIAGIRPDWPEFRSILNKAIKHIPHTVFVNIMEKWSHQSVKGNFLTPAERAWLQEHPVITVATDPDWKPIEFLNKRGTYQGVSIDYLKSIESLLGIRFSFVRKSWQEQYAAAKEKKIDILSCVAPTKERRKYFNFTNPYITMRSGIFAQSDISYISNMKLLKDKTIAVVENYGIHDYMVDAFPESALLLVKTPEQGLRAVSEGKAFAYIDNTLITSHLIRENGYTDLRMVGETPFVYNQSIGVRKDWPQLRSILNKALNEITEVEQQRIYNRWVPLIHEKSANYQLVWRVGGSVLVILILILLWNRGLAKQVAYRTADLRKSENKYRAIFETLQDGYVKTDLEGTIQLVNDVAADQFGYTQEELLQMNLVRDIFSNKTFGENLRMILLESGRVDSLEIALTRKNGTPLIVEANIHLISIENKPTFFEGTFRDITKRKESEREMARLASVLHQSHDDITITDPEGVIQYVNPGFEKILGYSITEALGNTPRLFKSGKHPKTFYKEMWDTITAGKVWSGNIINKHKNGVLIEEHATIFPVFDENGDIINYAGIKRDLTEYRKLESQLRHSQKMEAIGTLAGGIAHDFNNILAAILGYSEMALSGLNPEERVYSDITQVRNAGIRAKDLVAQILAFSRQEEKELHPMYMQMVIKEALQLIRSSIPTTIAIEQHISKECNAILADPTQIHQIIMNLCTNAYHAMRETGGELRVSLIERRIEPEDIPHHLQLQPGRYCCLDISDSGCGISKENMERIFEPYFTTKEKGEGTGLGLATVHGIVQSFHGDISVYSEIGRGTTFHIYLPIIEEKEADTESDRKEIPRGNEHLLIIDDDVTVKEMLERIVTSLGYTAEAFSSSKKAFKAFQSEPDRFDLILTDMTMPHITGDVLAQKALSLRPDIPIVMCTGYSEFMNRERAEKLGIKAFVMKPLITRELAEALRKELDAK